MTERIEYLDFDVEVAATPTADSYQVQVIASPKGEASATVNFPFSNEGLENVILKLGRTRSGVRALGSPTQELARTFGTALYDSIFAGEVGTCFRRSLDAADAAGKGLRIRLRLANAPKLTDVPWEYLYPSGLRKFLVLSRHTPVVRYLDLPREVAPLHVDPPLQVLLVVSAPTDLATLDVATEVKRIQDALADLEARGVVKVTTLETATLAELRRALRRGTFHVLHFIGHGGFDRVSGEGMLAFETDQRRAHLVSGTDLATLVQDHRTLRLAMLNACEGARQSPADPFSGVAQALVQNGLPAVVAMQFEITDTAALVLAQEFYSAIADGYPIDAALAEARVAVFSEGNDVEWGTPVLYLRASDGHIFDLATAPEPGTEAARAGREVTPDSPQAAAAAKVAAAVVIQEATTSMPVTAPLAAAVPTTMPPTRPTAAPVTPTAAPATPAAAPATPTAAPAMPTSMPPTASAPAGAPTAPSGPTQPVGSSTLPAGVFRPAGPQAPPPAPPYALPQTMPPGSTPPGRAPRSRRPVVLLGLLGVVVITVFLYWVGTLPDTGVGGAGASAGPATTIEQSPTGGPTTGGPTENPPPPVPAALVAHRGTPTIDGHGGEWPGTTFFYSDKVVFGDNTGVQGRTQLMWDADALYFLTEVADQDVKLPDPTKPDQVYIGDGVNLELGAASFDLGEQAKLRATDRHFMFGLADNTPRTVIGANKPNKALTTFVKGGRIDGVEAYAGAIDGGYQIEGRIPWSTTGLDGIGEGAWLAANINVSDRAADSFALACMVSTNGERTRDTQPHPGYWQTLQLQG